MCIMNVLHAEREHESIVSIDSMTQSELACLDLTTYSYSYKYPTMYAYHMSIGTAPLCPQGRVLGLRT